MTVDISHILRCGRADPQPLSDEPRWRNWRESDLSEAPSRPL